MLKVLLLLLSTPDQEEVLRVKCEFVIFPGNFFCMYKQMVFVSGRNNKVPLRHSARHFPEGNLVHISEI